MGNHVHAVYLVPLLQTIHKPTGGNLATRHSIKAPGALWFKGDRSFPAGASEHRGWLSQPGEVLGNQVHEGVPQAARLCEHRTSLPRLTKTPQCGQLGLHW